MTPTPIPRFRQELEEVWRDRVRRHLELYRTASELARRASDEVHAGLIPPPDGSHALGKALAQESDARARYISTLRIFTDLVLYGKYPDERDG